METLEQKQLKYLKKYLKIAEEQYKKECKKLEDYKYFTKSNKKKIYAQIYKIQAIRDNIHDLKSNIYIFEKFIWEEAKENCDFDSEM